MSSKNLKTIVFLPSNKINVQKNSKLLHGLDKSGFRILILCVDELMDSGVATLQSIINSGFEYLLVPGNGFKRNSHWIIQSFQKQIIVEQIHNIFDNESPTMLLTAFEGDTVPFWVSKEFQKQKIPVVLVPDGMVLEDSPRYTVDMYANIKGVIGRASKVLFGVGGPRGSSKPDHILLLNASGRSAFIKYGITPDRIHVVGTPEYENLKATHQELIAPQATEAKSHSELQVKAQKPYVFFAHQSNFGLNKHQMFEFVFVMATAVAKCGATLVVKFHHRSEQKVSEWENWRESVNLSDSDLLFADYNLYSIDILRKSTLCITAFSTVGLEAIYCKIPLVVIKFLNTQYELSFAEHYDCALNVYELSDLGDSIILLLTDETKRNHFIQNGLKALRTEVALDGTSSIEKSVELIQLITNNNG